MTALIVSAKVDSGSRLWRILQVLSSAIVCSTFQRIPLTAATVLNSFFKSSRVAVGWFP